MTDRLVLQSEHSFEDELVAAIEEGHEFTPIGADDCIDIAGTVCISVAEEQAVDSYNQMFTCSIHLNADQARQLRDWLIRNVP